MVPWLKPRPAEKGQLFPEDWWPYGVAGNRQAIDTLGRYFFEQGLSRQRFTCEEMFAPELLAT